MLSSALGTPNFNWNVSPASHELEWIVADWMVKLLGLPEKFLFDKEGAGGITNSITEASFLSVNLAKTKNQRIKFGAY